MKLYRCTLERTQEAELFGAQCEQTSYVCDHQLFMLSFDRHLDRQAAQEQRLVRSLTSIQLPNFQRKSPNRRNIYNF